jgi:hypothetical protein
MKGFYRLKRRVVVGRAILKGGKKAGHTRRPKTIEEIKEVSEFSKYLTTVSTGSLLILIAMLERIFTHARWRLLAALAY